MVIVGVAAGVWIGRISIPATSTDGSGHTAASHAAEGKSEVWTCSMHPQIQKPGPGKCPICGMDLIPVRDDSGSGEDRPRAMKMSESAKALADIQTEAVRREYPTVEVRLVGKIDYDETRVRSLTARFPARIDELYVNFTGVNVEEGDHLADVYSPELLTAQRELLTAYRNNPDSTTTQIAKEKLRLWDLLPEQIESIIESGEATDHFVLRAPVGGVVVSKNVKEGDYLKTGQPLFKIADLDELWLFLDAYESDLAWLRYGEDVVFNVEAYPGETFHGRISFIEPEVNRTTRTVSVRVNVANLDGRLKPGMFARGLVKPRVAASGAVFSKEFAGKWISPMHPEVLKDGPGQCDVCGMDLVPVESLGYVDDADVEAPLVVPVSAVLRTGKRAVVYVEIPDTEKPTFEGREIALGPRAGKMYVVSEGLLEGERVVTNGAFKIDSALQIMAKPSMMSPEGGGSVPGHNHGGGAAPAGGTDHSGHQMSAEIPNIDPGEVQKSIDHYFKIQGALAGDDLIAAHNAISVMLEAVGHTSGLAQVLHPMLAIDSLDALRKPHFEVLSNTMIDAIKSHEDEFQSQYYVKHCPMVYPDRGADWLQSSEATRNPYFGAAMLGCGETKGILGVGK